MATLTVRAPTKRDRMRLRNVRQRRVSLLAPWDPHADPAGRQAHGLKSTAVTLLASDIIVAAVDDEVCAYLVYERGDERYRWNICWLGAGSPRVDATDEVAAELWLALLEEGVRGAGRSGARRLFAYCAPDSIESESLRQAGFSGFTEYEVLRGRFKRGLRESIPVREQHESDLWSIHQLYNRTTPRPVQFAEAFTSDAWSTDSASRIPFRNRQLLGYVLPTEDGIGAACHIDLTASCPMVSLLCDDHLSHAIPSIVAEALEHASLHGDVDVVLPAYQLDRQSSFVNLGFASRKRVVAMVRHTTATAVQMPLKTEVLKLSEARPAVSIPYRGLTFAGIECRVRDGA